MKAILTAAAASLIVAGAFAQVQTGTPTHGSKLGGTPPASTSVTADTSRLSTDCDKVAEKQRSHQAGGQQLGANCGTRATTMGASGTGTAATAAATPSRASGASGGTAMSSDTTSSNVAQADTSGKGSKARKAR